MKKYLVLGHGRHGKDTFASYLCNLYGLSFTSSSMVIANLFFEEKGKELNYSSLEQCYLDRVNHRELWESFVKSYNTPDKAKLATQIYKDSDIYVGMRCPLEFEATMNRFNPVVFWVSRSPVKIENDPTMKIEYDSSFMKIVRNVGSLDFLERQAKSFKNLFT